MSLCSGSTATKGAVTFETAPGRMFGIRLDELGAPNGNIAPTTLDGSAWTGTATHSAAAGVHTIEDTSDAVTQSTVFTMEVPQRTTTVAIRTTGEVRVTAGGGTARVTLTCGTQTDTFTTTSASFVAWDLSVTNADPVEQATVTFEANIDAPADTGTIEAQDVLVALLESATDPMPPYQDTTTDPSEAYIETWPARFAGDPVPFAAVPRQAFIWCYNPRSLELLPRGFGQRNGVWQFGRLKVPGAHTHFSGTGKPFSVIAVAEFIAGTDNRQAIWSAMPDGNFGNKHGYVFDRQRLSPTGGMSVGAFQDTSTFDRVGSLPYAVPEKRMGLIACSANDASGLGKTWIDGVLTASDTLDQYDMASNIETVTIGGYGLSLGGADTHGFNGYLRAIYGWTKVFDAADFDSFQATVATEEGVQYGFTPAILEKIDRWGNEDDLPASGAVASWADAGPAGNDASQATGADQPTVTTLGSGKAVVCTSSVEWFDLDAQVIAGDGVEIWFAAAVKWEDADDGTGRQIAGNPAATQWVARANATDALNVRTSAGQSAIGATNSVLTGDSGVYLWLRNTSNEWRCWKRADGGSLTEISTSPVTVRGGTITVGELGRAGLANPFVGRIGEHALGQQVDLTSGTGEDAVSNLVGYIYDAQGFS